MRKARRPCVWTLLCAGGLLMPLAASPRAPRGVQKPDFNGTRAFADLQRLAEFGPRPAGSKALGDTRQWIIRELREDNLKVGEDSFVAATPVGNIPMTNLVVKIPGARSRVLILAGHYDTAPIKDFVGANDGGSSAAMLLELARVLSRRRNELTLWLVFFDGEEAVRQWSESDSLYGSRHLAERLAADGELSGIGALILVDMIGDAKLDIYRDANSTPWLTDIIFTTAHRLGYARVFLSAKQAYGDDHIPFVNAGVSAVDLLGNVGPATPSASFGSYWHTPKDTVDKCSPRSLTIVGRVVTASIEELEKSPQLH